MVDSLMVRDDQVDNQIVVLPEDLQHRDDSEFQPTPNGTPYWVPDVPEDEKPKEGLLFDSYNDAYETYLVYSQKARFNTRKCGFKRKNGQKTHAYFQCNRAGKPRRSKEVNTLNEVNGEDGENSASKKKENATADETMKCNYVAFGDVVSFDATFHTNKHKKQPPFAVIDQDGALRNAVVKMFPDSHHRSCDLAADNNFRKDFHKLVWNLYIGPDRKMGPWFFKEVPMCGLMKTTSRSESSNAFFQIYSHEGNTLVQFMLCFESAMEKQRYTQRVLDNASNGSTLTVLTELPFEKHACDVYTPSVFKEVQHEIHKILYACTQIRSDCDGSVETCIIQQMDKRSNSVIRTTVIFLNV
nr:hypothetical protein [Tanacetum cinerariifolium]